MINNQKLTVGTQGGQKNLSKYFFSLPTFSYLSRYSGAAKSLLIDCFSKICINIDFLFDYSEETINYNYTPANTGIKKFSNNTVKIYRKGIPVFKTNGYGAFSSREIIFKTIKINKQL